jgi:glucose-6-phosphate 1-dehydrogenase
MTAHSDALVIFGGTGDLAQDDIPGTLCEGNPN